MNHIKHGPDDDCENCREFWAWFLRERSPAIGEGVCEGIRASMANSADTPEDLVSLRATAAELPIEAIFEQCVEAMRVFARRHPHNSPLTAVAITLHAIAETLVETDEAVRTLRRQEAIDAEARHKHN